MRASHIAFISALAVVVLSGPAAEAAKSKPNIVIVATGGTIAGAAKSETDVGYTSGAVAVDTLIEAVPQLTNLASVRGVQVASIPSQDMNDDVWIKLANTVNDLLDSKGVDGIVITHGTDTMEETAYFLNLVVDSEKPVVMTGSMRPSTAMSADGPLNIYNAVAVTDPRARDRGVLVAVNDDIHAASRHHQDPHHRRRDVSLERAGAGRRLIVRHAGVLPLAHRAAHGRQRLCGQDRRTRCPASTSSTRMRTCRPT